MAVPDTSKRLREEVLKQDLAALRGAKIITDYAPARPEASIEALSEAEAEINRLRALEIEIKAQQAAILDQLREAEWKLHNGVQAMKSSVLAQFGKNSDQAEWVGFTKPEDYKKPQRKPNDPDDSNNPKS
jgi:hypothetical protein